jgi:hypothetical protein
MFFSPFDAHSSTLSAIVDDGVIGNIAATSVKAYEMCAAAVFPSMVFIFLMFVTSPLNIFEIRPKDFIGAVYLHLDTARCICMQHAALYAVYLHRLDKNLRAIMH